MDWLMPETSVGLARESGVESRAVTLTLMGDRSIRMSAFDSGPTAERLFGRADCEWILDVDREALPELAITLLRERYDGRTDAVDDLRDLCTRHGVAHQFGGR
jgi:hypothetical protein